MTLAPVENIPFIVMVDKPPEEVTPQVATGARASPVEVLAVQDDTEARAKLLETSIVTTEPVLIESPETENFTLYCTFVTRVLVEERVRVVEVMDARAAVKRKKTRAIVFITFFWFDLMIICYHIQAHSEILIHYLYSI